MPAYIYTILEYFLRILLAGICGGLIGFERKNRGKGAGLKTHIIVAIASALMMIISKYGFNDLAFGADFRLDPSRVASQIVSGVGFLGAGMIFIQKRAVKGLTTAAGVWATSGIGMAIGAGMYAIGIITSVTILIVQFITHKQWKFLKQPNEHSIIFTLTDNDSSNAYLEKYLKSLDINILDLSVSKTENGNSTVTVNALLPQSFDMLSLLNFDKAYITSIEYNE